MRRAGTPVANWFEAHCLRPDGTRVPLQVGVAPERIGGRPAMVSFFFDLTERKRAVEALARSEARFRQIIEHAPEAVWLFAPNKGLVFVNPEMVRMLSFPDADTLLRASPEEIVHPDDLGTMRARIDLVLGEGQALPPRDYRLLRRDGKVVMVEVSSIRTEWQGEASILSFGRDVSARKEMEARLSQADRLAALGTMVAGIAHEINNPLTYTSLSVERATALLASDGLPEALRLQLEECLGDIRRGTERVTGIVRELRAFSRAEADRPVPLNLADVIAQALRFVQNEIRHRARLETDFGVIPHVEGIGPRLEQVFVNLLVNAAHALPDERASQNRIRVVLRVEGAKVIAEVEDNGAGVAPEILPHIFDPFFTTKAEQKGMGLGLSICHRIVTAHHGTIGVTSTKGAGTTFRVTLPALAHLPAARQGPGAEDTPIPEPRRRRLLLVDDEPLVGRALGSALGAHYDVHFADGFSQAVAALAADPRGFDLIMCDVMMPGLTGMDLFEEVERSHPHLARKILFMTGGAFTPRSAAFLDATANPVIMKPFSAAEAIAALAKI
jgi:PAS domain S-box-containing protein